MSLLFAWRCLARVSIVTAPAHPHAAPAQRAARFPVTPRAGRAVPLDGVLVAENLIICARNSLEQSAACCATTCCRGGDRAVLNTEAIAALRGTARVCRPIGYLASCDARIHHP